MKPARFSVKSNPRLREAENVTYAYGSIGFRSTLTVVIHLYLYHAPYLPPSDV
jgi:hypothetical protein